MHIGRLQVTPNHYKDKLFAQSCIITKGKVMNQTPDEYRLELEKELADLEAAQLKVPTEYKQDRINRLRGRLNLPATTQMIFKEPK
jgi:hypothetical protein